MSKKNKLSFHYDRSIKFRGHRPNNYISVSTNDPLSDVVQTTQLNYIGEIKWTSPITNSLLAEAAMFTLPVNYSLSFEPDAAADAVATHDQTRSAIYGVSPRQDKNDARMFTYAANLSYITGTHALKGGFQVRTGYSQEQFTSRGDIVQVIVNDQPNSVRLLNTPSGHKEEGINAGLYVQDSWRLARLTLNPGVRFEHFGMSIPAQSAPAGTWIGARDFPAQNDIINWNTVSPRIGFSVDLFGDGETAIKGGVSRYDRLEGITLVQPLNQRNISFKTCPWADANRDLHAQLSEIDQNRCSGSLLPT